MAKNSGIDWTDHTWNPFQGCRKVSPGCAHCYMYRDKKRYGQDPATVIRSKPGTFNAPLHWKEPAKVFVCSWSDFFIEDADEWREEAWDIMRATPHLTYMLLTKRPENIKGRLPMSYEAFGGGWPLKNVWLGVTVESQEMADKRIPLLLQVPAAMRFISVEPMIGPVDLTMIHPEGKLYHQNCLNGWAHDGAFFKDNPDAYPGDEKIDWVICGGESGPDARWMAHEWAFELKKQCLNAGVPFFMKQMARKEPIPEFLQGREFPRSI